MAKLTLNDLASLTNENTALSTLANNNTATETALENTLSRDGTSPNAMNASLDMNSNRILNLPEPLADTEPARLVDVTAGITGHTPGIRQTYSSTTTDSDPGAGTFRLNHATPASATAMYLDNTDTGGSTVSTLFDLWDDSTSTVKGFVRIEKSKSPATWAEFDVTGSVVDGTGYRKLTLSNGAGSGVFTNGDTFVIVFYAKGDKGDTGTAGASPGINQTYSTTTADADPGAGVFRLNNATPASATAGYFDNLDSSGNTVSSIFDLWDDSTNTTKGSLYIVKTTDASKFVRFNVTGSVVDGTGYRKLTLANGVGSGVFTNGDTFALTFSRAGDKGADGTIAGSTGVTDNAVLRADGIGGTTLQNSAVTIDDTGNIAGVGTIDIGNVDTTLSRSAAGVVAVEGVTLVRGSTGATDNAALRADSTGGSLAQASALIIADTTGALSRSGNGGIPVQGTNTNNNAAAGDVGEYTNATLGYASRITLVSATGANVTSISLTAGDWDVTCTGYIEATGSPTSNIYNQVSISTTSNTLSGTDGEYIYMAPGLSVANQTVAATTTVRKSLSATTTIYLVAQSSFSAGTFKAWGTISARRVR